MDTPSEVGGRASRQLRSEAVPWSPHFLPTRVGPCEWPGPTTVGSHTKESTELYFKDQLRVEVGRVFLYISSGELGAV